MRRKSNDRPSSEALSLKKQVLTSFEVPKLYLTVYGTSHQKEVPRSGRECQRTDRGGGNRLRSSGAPRLARVHHMHLSSCRISESLSVGAERQRNRYASNLHNIG